jgi:hypothetical protein
MKILQEKLAKDHTSANQFTQPMKGFPQYQNKIWKYDCAPEGDSNAHRKGWRLLAYVDDPNAPEPIVARAFLCYDKAYDPGGNPGKFIAGHLKKFLAAIVVKPQATPDRFRRQHLSDGRIASSCDTCWETLISADEGEAELSESAHECPGEP